MALILKMSEWFICASSLLLLLGILFAIPYGYYVTITTYRETGVIAFDYLFPAFGLTIMAGVLIFLFLILTRFLQKLQKVLRVFESRFGNL